MPWLASLRKAARTEGLVLGVGWGSWKWIYNTNSWCCQRSQDPKQIKLTWSLTWMFCFIGDKIRRSPGWPWSRCLSASTFQVPTWAFLSTDRPVTFKPSPPRDSSLLLTSAVPDLRVTTPQEAIPTNEIKLMLGQESSSWVPTSSRLAWDQGWQ